MIGRSSGHVILAALLAACAPAAAPQNDDALVAEIRAAMAESPELPRVVAGLAERGCSFDPERATLVVDQRDGHEWGVLFERRACATPGRRAAPMVLAHRARGAAEWEVVAGSVIYDLPGRGGAERHDPRFIAIDDMSGELVEIPLDEQNVTTLREWYTALPGDPPVGDVGGSSMGVVEHYRMLSTSCAQALGVTNAAGGTCCQCMADAQHCLSYEAMQPQIVADCYRTLVCAGERSLATPDDWAFTFDLPLDERVASSCGGDAGCHTQDELCEPYRVSGDLASRDVGFCAEVYSGFDIRDHDRGEYPTLTGQLTSIIGTASLAISVINPVAGAAGVTLTTVSGINAWLGPLKSLLGMTDQTTGNFDRLHQEAGEGSWWGPQGLQMYCGGTSLSYSCHYPLCLTTYGECLNADVTCSQAPTEQPDGSYTCATGRVVEPDELEAIPSVWAFDWERCCSTGLHFEYRLPTIAAGDFSQLSFGLINGVGGVHTPGFECVFYYPEGTTLPTGVPWPTQQGELSPGTGPSWGGAPAPGGRASPYTCTWAPAPMAMDGEPILSLGCGGGP